MQMLERGRRRRLPSSLPDSRPRSRHPSAASQKRREEVNLALYATDDADGFTKVCLGMPWRMHQRHEHLLCPLPPAGDIVLHDCYAACEGVFVPKPLENPLRRMVLLLRSRLA